MAKFPTKITCLLLGALALGSLGGCGKKGSHVYAPDDLEDDNYPFIYPDPATDPGSTVEPQAQVYQKQQSPKKPAQPPATQDQQ